MRQVRIHGPDRVSVDTVEAPLMGPRDIVVRIAACGICGSDLSYARGGWVRPDGQPLPLGHEAAGTVAAVGSQVSGITSGMRVLVNPIGDPANAIGNGGSEGAFADMLLVRDARPGQHVLQIPDDMSMTRAALVEPLAVALHGVHRGEVSSDSKAAVFGAGPIGLGALLWLKRQGLTDIVAVDVSEDRLEYARRMGAHVTINPRRENLHQRLRAIHGAGNSATGEETVGTDVYFDMAGGKDVIANIIDVSQYHARVVVTAVYPKPVEVDFLKMLMKELIITTAGGYPPQLQDVLSEVHSVSEAELSPYISHQFALPDFLTAFATAKESKSAKVMINFE